MTAQTAILAAIATPALFAVVVFFLGERNRLRDMASTIGTLVTFALVVSLLTKLLAGEALTVEVLEIVPGVSLAFEVEPLGMVYALVASGLWIVTSIYAIGYMRAHDEQRRVRFQSRCALAAQRGQLLFVHLYVVIQRVGVVPQVRLATFVDGVMRLFEMRRF